MQWGQSIKALRELRGLSQRELADATGFDRSYINSIENGKRKYPSYSMLLRLSKALKVPFMILMLYVYYEGAHGEELHGQIPV
jgi:Predicted transcriptional regulators